VSPAVLANSRPVQITTNRDKPIPAKISGSVRVNAAQHAGKSAVSPKARKITASNGRFWLAQTIIEKTYVLNRHGV
jgi:hypothetical protein